MRAQDTSITFLGILIQQRFVVRREEIGIWSPSSLLARLRWSKRSLPNESNAACHCRPSIGESEVRAFDNSGWHMLAQGRIAYARTHP